jgi:catechol 2,3-dioxygenase-like lactoylglutathione lyase family enzyme
MTSPTTETANVQQAVPFFMVSSMEASLAFYRDGLGFVMTRDWIKDGRLTWCWLELGGAALMLQELDPKGRHPRTAVERVGVGVSVYFICRDALELYRQFRARGVPARRPFVGNGMWVTSLKDPDGYDIHFESLTDAAEESEYAE